MPQIRALAEDNTGRLAAIQTGINGSLQKWAFHYDKNGSLSQRSDTTNGADWKEEFIYDNLDRLSTVKQVRTNGVATPSSVTLALQYDQLGNITSKTGTGSANLGSYQYKSFEAGCKQQAGPHAASLVNGKSYCYDENGNNTEVRKDGSVIRTIVYTGFDLAETITRDELTPEGRIQASVSFKYGTDRAMFKRVDGATGGNADQLMKSGFEDGETPPSPSSGAKTTYYVGNVEFIREGTVLTTKRYVGNYLVITQVANNPVSYDYLLRDSLGSIDTIASETGQLKSRQSFNAHGQRRQAAQAGITNSWNAFSLLQAALFNTSTTTQGYTGHEQLDGVGLVHMNARLYDPELGRFIQADDYVEPEATQGLNRYSYVLNNPMSATDPSGNFSLRQALGIVVGVAFAILSHQYWVLDKLLASFATAVAGGFASAAISTGSLKAGLWGAVSAAAFWGIGTAFSKLQYVGPKPGANNLVEAVFKRASSGNALAKIAAHAVAGGTLTELQGGKFGHGFVAAGFTEALSPAVGQIKGDKFGAVLGRAAASAAIGGTASTLSGGSFANGAKTGAFQQLFNETAHGLSSGRNENEAGTFETEVPSGLEELFKKYPELELKMRQTIEASKSHGFFDRVEERGFFAVIGNGTGKLYLIDCPAAQWVWQSNTYGNIPINEAPQSPYFKLIVIYHTHPYFYSFGNALPWSQTVPRGPSYQDQAFANRYPGSFSIVESLNERFYFGPRVRAGGR
jgi:RHS repeat-associated protein